jgi:outer membrane protein TolC
MILFAGFLLASSSAFAAPLTFDEAVRTMLGRDTEVGAVSAEAEAASALALGKRYHLLPTISFDATDSEANYHDNVRSLVGTASLSLFKFGADSLAADAANAHERSVRAKLERTRLDREKQAVDVLLEFIRASEAREILGSLEKMGNESITVAERQYAGGRLASQEVQKVKIDVENTRFQKTEAEQAWVDARSAVEARLGDANVLTLFPWKEKIEATRAGAVDPSEILKLRPEWIEAEEESNAADSTARSARRGLLPVLNARGTYGWTRDPLYAPDYQLGWEAAITFSIPLFSGFRDYASSRVQVENAAATQLRLEGVRRDVLAETRSVPSRYEIARQSALARESILKSSRQLYQDNLSRFRQGRATSDELSVDLKRYLDIQLGALNGWVSAHQAFVALAHLHGACATDCGRRPISSP